MQLQVDYPLFLICQIFYLMLVRPLEANPLQDLTRNELILGVEFFLLLVVEQFANVFEGRLGF